MIVTRTPFRISFCGGITDFPQFYHQEFGCVVSTAIDRYMYITLNRKFGGDIRIGYSKTEIVTSVDQIQHPTARECLRFLGVTGVEITSNADVPAATGLGSSGSFTVGLLNALYTYLANPQPGERLAKEANYIEIELAKQISGKQDHYIAAYGGLRYIQFNPDESVLIERIDYPYLSDLKSNLMLLYTGERTKPATSIQIELLKNLKIDTVKEMKKLALDLRTALIEGQHPSVLAKFLHEDWIIKKELTQGITTPVIDEIYQAALDAGALGGKLLGAGGGGFMLLYCPKENQERIREALGLKVMPFRFEVEGSKVVYNDTRNY